MGEFKHISVLLNECIENLNIKKAIEDTNVPHNTAGVHSSCKSNGRRG